MGVWLGNLDHFYSSFSGRKEIPSTLKARGIFVQNKTQRFEAGLTANLWSTACLCRVQNNLAASYYKQNTRIQKKNMFMLLGEITLWSYVITLELSSPPVSLLLYYIKGCFGGPKFVQIVTSSAQHAFSSQDPTFVISFTSVMRERSNIFEQPLLSMWQLAPRSCKWIHLL